MKTILAIGDDIDWESFLKLKRKRGFFRKNKVIFKTVDYSSIIKNRLPDIRSKGLFIILFFPLEYWNTRIEQDFTRGRIYGDRKCALMFYSYMDKVRDIILDRYKGKDITFLNSFKAVKVDRDKALTKKVIEKHVNVPKSFSTRKLQDIIRLLDKGKKLYIKVNFGAMGKGITRLDKNRWLTNFIYRNGSIISRKGDYGWRFKDVTGRKDFLEKLLKKDIIIEEAVSPYIIDSKKFDIRYYILYGRVRHGIIRSTLVKNVVTNITQGGHKEDKNFLRKIPKKYLKKAEKSAVKAAKALSLNLAGVDVIISDKGIPYVIEAQSFPGFPASRHNFSEKLAREVIKRI
ncbi:hypothetical protein KY366_06350 [Candidatus Woesearchaeota archaeon]|nr:hypothetical protein [Candidatus Woesearchaeota archaeon]